MEKESEKYGVYVHVQVNHFAVHLKLTQRCQSTALQYKIQMEKDTSSFITYDKPEATLWFMPVMPRVGEGKQLTKAFHTQGSKVVFSTFRSRRSCPSVWRQGT